MEKAGTASRHELHQILAFYRDSGVTVCLSEQPVDRLAAGPDDAGEAARILRALSPPLATKPAQRPAQQPVERHRPDGTSPTPENHAGQSGLMKAPPPLAKPAVTGGKRAMPETGGTRSAPAEPRTGAGMDARERAGEAQTLEELRAALEAFDGCGLKHTATNLVFADGNPEGRVMFVGEAPGREEDKMGLPFVGRSGQLLDRMLAAIGLDRSAVYIANAVPWRPPGNRTPSPEETEICRPFIERQITLADPDFLIPLGSPSAKMLFRTTAGITRIRGQWRTYTTGKREIRAMASLHPAYLLRQPLQKRFAWRDFLALKSALEGKTAD
ncbi:MAG: uracil-DNA glycosylase [Alphaproteobacteria bacterium]